MQPVRERLRVAIAGDLHGQWDPQDQQLLRILEPDALLVVGDLSDGHARIPLLLRESQQQLGLPIACILGNHDTGRDPSGQVFQSQLDLLGPLHCGWGLNQWSVLPRGSHPHRVPSGLAVIGARPGSAGGGFHLSPACQGVFGPLSLEESVERMVRAALQADPGLPLLLLAHSGPTGLGSEAGDPCGRDWKSPACDWGDQDLAIAIQRISRHRSISLVVFGHMHHRLKRGASHRCSFVIDRSGLAYLNAACVPRHLIDHAGIELRHFSWVEFDSDGLQLAAHRWYDLKGALRYEEILYSASSPPQPRPPVVSC